MKYHHGIRTQILEIWGIVDSSYLTVKN